MTRCSRFLGWVALVLLAAAAQAAEAPRMGADELLKRLDSPELTLIDVRSEHDWATSDTKIRGAVREDPRHVKAWAPHYRPDQLLVLYCA